MNRENNQFRSQSTGADTRSFRASAVCRGLAATFSKACIARNRYCIRTSAGMGDRILVHFVAAAVFSALLVVPASAQDDATLTLNFQDADIRALINTVSTVTGRNFVVDPRVKGKVTVVSGKKMSTTEIYNVFLSVLEVHNFAAVPSGNVTKILPSNIVKHSSTAPYSSSCRSFARYCRRQVTLQRTRRPIRWCLLTPVPTSRE